VQELNKIGPAFVADGLHNPYRVGAPRGAHPQGWPPCVGQPWAVMHNPYGVGYRGVAHGYCNPHSNWESL